jgi:hypothetical protein
MRSTSRRTAATSLRARPGAQKRLENCKALAEINVRSGKVETLALHKDWDFDAPRYSPDGLQIAFAASQIGRKHTMPAHAHCCAAAAAGRC